jgi:hypothetical protein
MHIRKSKKNGSEDNKYGVKVLAEFNYLKMWVR